MLLLLTLLFGDIAFGSLRQKYQYDYMPQDDSNSSNSSGLLGICYGQKTKWANDPYVVALRGPAGRACCSGSIASLDPPVIITAAHCQVCFPGDVFGDVFIGCNNPAHCDGDSYTIIDFYTDGYDPWTLYNDIMLLVLADPITTEGAEAVEIPIFEPQEGKARVIGYGRDESGELPTHLSAATAQLLNRQYCDDIFDEIWGPISPPWVDISQTCFLDQSGNPQRAGSPCHGDSGGPIGLRRGNQAMQQYGVISWGVRANDPNCNYDGECNCCTQLPFAGANVPYFSSFIEAVIGISMNNNKGDFNYTRYGDKIKQIKRITFNN